MAIVSLTDRVLGVKIRYADGTIVQLPMGELEKWRDAPLHGVQVVSVYDTHTCNVENQHLAAHLAGQTLYWFESGVGWGNTDRPTEVPSGAHVLIGTLMDKDAFRVFYNAVLHDLDF